MPLIRILFLLSALFMPPLARGEIVVVTSLRNGPMELSRDQAEKLYLGRSGALSDGTPVILIDLPTGATRDEFYMKLTGKNPTQIQAYWSRIVFTGRASPPKEAGSVTEARQWLADIPNTIGYLERGDAPPGLRILLRLP